MSDRARSEQKGLFRTEVGEAGRCDPHAFVAWRPSHFKAVSLGLCVFVLVSTVWLMRTEYAQKLTVPGLIEPLRPPVDVFSREGGVVKVVSVREGEWIEAGDTLLTLGLDVRYGEGQTRADIEARRVRESLKLIDAEIGNLDTSFALANEQSASREARLRDSLLLASERVVLAERQLTLATERRGYVERLVEQGSLAALEGAREERAALQTHEALIARRQEVQRLTYELRELVLAGKLRRQESLRERAKLERELALGRVEIDAINARRQERIVGPLDGRVTNLRAEPGQHADTRRPLMTIVPASSPHRAVLFLQSSAVWKVDPGIAAHVRYVGVGIQEHRPVEGRVVGVGRAPLPLVAGSHDRLFKAEVDLIEVPDFARNVPAGTQVEADLRLAAKPIWRWLAEPMRNAVSRL